MASEGVGPGADVDQPGEKGGRRSEPSPNAAPSVRRALLRWFREKGRRFPWREEGVSLYKQVVAEVLLQRTRAETVAAFFEAFVTRFPGWQSLADSSVEDIGVFLKPIGLWQRRSVSLSALAREMASRQGVFPRTRNEIEELPGVGQYIANAILMFAHGQPEPLLDVNMARVLERVFGPRKLADIRYDPYLQQLSREVIRGTRAAEVNWAILDLAAKVCTISKPKCDICPIAKWCKYAANRTR
jgi:A/G-specific adenine glycosylase